MFRTITRIGGYLTPFPFWLDSLGKKGEYLALRYFRRKGYYLVGKNQRIGRWELDLILCNGREIIVLEVKARRPKGEPKRIGDLVSFNQRERIHRAGQSYLKKKNWQSQIHRYLLVYILFQEKEKLLLAVKPGSWQHEITVSDLELSR